MKEMSGCCKQNKLQVMNEHNKRNRKNEPDANDTHKRMTRTARNTIEESSEDCKLKLEQRTETHAKRIETKRNFAKKT